MLARGQRLSPLEKKGSPIRSRCLRFRSDTTREPSYTNVTVYPSLHRDSHVKRLCF